MGRRVDRWLPAMSVLWWVSAGFATFGVRGGLCVFLVIGGRRLKWRPKKRRDPEALIDLVTLLAVAIRAGVPLGLAFEVAAREVGTPVEGEVDALLRSARLRGLAVALTETTGLLGRLASHLARAQVSGASMASAIETFLTSLRDEEQARLAERARTLPVKLILPISLLLLPGFVALVLGPYVIDQLGGLASSVGP